MLGDGDWPGFLSERLFAADLVPVCSPAGGAAHAPATCKAPQLLRVAHAGDEWPHMACAADVGRIAARGPEFEYYGQALQAAADGVGVAMGIRALYRRRCRRGPAGGAVRAGGAERPAVVSDLSGGPRGRGGVPGVPSVDRARRGALASAPAREGRPAAGRRYWGTMSLALRRSTIFESMAVAAESFLGSFGSRSRARIKGLSFR